MPTEQDALAHGCQVILQKFVNSALERFEKADCKDQESLNAVIAEVVTKMEKYDLCKGKKVEASCELTPEGSDCRMLASIPGSYPSSIRAKTFIEKGV